MKKVLILGITGQDGSYLAELLLKQGYEVHGMIRKSATGNTINIEHLLDKIICHKGDLLDLLSVYKLIKKINPEVIYNEADQDHVSWSYDLPNYSFDITGATVGKILEMIRDININIKYFQPVSSNIFGKANSSPQNEKSEFNPQSPYGLAKVFAFEICKYYRNVHKMFVSSAIFYNHESVRRAPDYVTRKITKAAAKISLGLQDKLYLGNLDTKVDFGYAPEYMKAAFDIMQLEKPDDFIISSGEAHSVKDFLIEAFKVVNLNPDNYVEFDKSFSRNNDTSMLIGDYTKASKAFDYKPKTNFKEIIKIMVENDLKLNSKV